MTTIAPPSLVWPEWTDRLGQVYKPGDVVAYAYTSGRSANLQFGIVDKINRYRKNGEEIKTGYGNTGKPSCTVRVNPLTKFEGKWTVHKVDRIRDLGGSYKSVLTDGLSSPKTWLRPECVIKINIEIEEP